MFANASSITHYELLHDEENTHFTSEHLFGCQTCKKIFDNATELHRHELKHTVRQRERKYVCSTCSLAFTSSANLRSHVRTHTGERPYACENCDMTFSHYATVRRHQRYHCKKGSFFVSTIQDDGTEGRGGLEGLQYDGMEAGPEQPSRYFYNHCNLGCGICGEMYDTRNAAKSCFYTHLVNDSNEQSTAPEEMRVKLEYNQEMDESAERDKFVRVDSACDDDDESLNLCVNNTSLHAAQYVDTQLCSQEMFNNKKDKLLPTSAAPEIDLIDATIASVVSMSRPLLYTNVETQKSVFYAETEQSGASSTSKHKRHKSSDELEGRDDRAAGSETDRITENTFTESIVAEGTGESNGWDNLMGAMSTEELSEISKKPFACTLCSYRCIRRSHLAAHMRSHTGEKPFACMQCSYRCSQSVHLANHLRSHTGEKPFACSACSYRCNTNGDLSKHMLIHTGEKPFSCTQCSFKCNQSSHLSRHMRGHTVGYTFPCTLCSYRCSKSDDLSKHMLTHSVEKPFACTVCSYKCTRSSHLATHMFSHTGEKPFACMQCSYRCSVSSSLARHIRSHSDEKPFACTLCTYRCRSNTDLSTHMRCHTG